MLILNSLIVVGLVVFVYMTIWFAISLIVKRNDVADVAWGVGFILASFTPILFYGLQSSRSILVTTLVVIWGSRLAYHVAKRNIRKSEDPRYATWRVEWSKWFIIRSYLQVFILQGLLLILIVSPVVFINTYPSDQISILDILGLIVWCVGFYFESRGDAELKAFLSNPENKGKILDSGLWKYTRHPNYFGEVTQWWGIWIIALSVSGGYLSIIGPLTITFLILKVSGVPMLEKSMAKNPLFENYRKNTSVFIPMFPKKQDSVK